MLQNQTFKLALTYKITIQSKILFCLSVQDIEKQNKLKTKVVYRFSKWHRKIFKIPKIGIIKKIIKIINPFVELSYLMTKSGDDLVKLINL